MKITFEGKLLKIQSRQILVIPLEASKKLPSRGMVMACVLIDKISFVAPLEPDGRGSHWFEVSKKRSEEAGLKMGELFELSMEAIKEWPEAEIPGDILDEIDKANLRQMWDSISTKARWDWLRWIRSTANIETRKKRIKVACSKLAKGDKHPCCFDRTRCSVTDVSKSGQLLY